MKTITRYLTLTALLLCAACQPQGAYQQSAYQPARPAPAPQYQPHYQDGPLSDFEIQRIQQLHQPQRIMRAISPRPPYITERPTLASAEVYFYIHQARLIDDRCRLMDARTRGAYENNYISATQMMQASLAHASRPPLHPTDIQQRLQALQTEAAAEARARQFYQCGSDAQLVVKYGTFEAAEWQRTYGRNARAYGY